LELDGISVVEGYPGYDMDHEKLGKVLPRHVVVGSVGGLRYEDELAVTWR